MSLAKWLFPGNMTGCRAGVEDCPSLEITEDDLTGSSCKLKNKLKKNMKLVFHKKLIEAAEDKSKMK